MYWNPEEHTVKNNHRKWPHNSDKTYFIIKNKPKKKKKKKKKNLSVKNQNIILIWLM